MVHMSEDKQPLNVFLCHAHDDKVEARKLYRVLKWCDVQPWMDSEDLYGGQVWEEEIHKALENSDAIIIFLSKKSVKKEGYIQTEIRRALNISEEKPDGTIFIIPLRLEVCDVPTHLKKYQWVDLFEYGFDKLIKSLNKRAEQLGRMTVKIPSPPEPKLELPKDKNDHSDIIIIVIDKRDLEGGIQGIPYK